MDRMGEEAVSHDFTRASGREGIEQRDDTIRAEVGERKHG